MRFIIACVDVGDIKPLYFIALPSEGAHDSDTRDGVVHYIKQLRSASPRAVPQAAHLPPKPARAQDDNRNRNQDEAGEFPIHPKEHAADAEEQQ